jgi:hypothetical protein
MRAWEPFFMPLVGRRPMIPQVEMAVLLRVRLPPLGGVWVSSCNRTVKSRSGRFKSVPQRLKPSQAFDIFGTARSRALRSETLLQRSRDSGHGNSACLGLSILSSSLPSRITRGGNASISVSEVRKLTMQARNANLPRITAFDR